ncbi:hypothetical protein HYH02_006746 [Chlamydomonas schloesseri]|uniref:Uncharacterized protein n=1 Tax=Chlamydomonas schloesseri TaxID=2026947 RepID=A0A836B5D5_9CHLO|nr:hypothetical protein HYH02_006746 [Chlamydomonas schloesseri]|eukprot:KAG2448161.1 hypothetical protein HYH02_006746 [Chlamydomonas schloesseri]
MWRTSAFHTLERGGISLLSSSDTAAEEHATASGGGGLACALAPQQRSALVALACPDLPPSALSGRLHLQAQQRARSALGRHERACASGYRPHLRAAATARAVLAVGAGLARDEAAAARQQQLAELVQKDHEAWERLLKAAQRHGREIRAYVLDSDKVKRDTVRLGMLGAATMAVIDAVEDLECDPRTCASDLASMQPQSQTEAEARRQTSACGPLLPRPLEGVATSAWLQCNEALRLGPARTALLLHCHMILAHPVVPYSTLVAEDAMTLQARRTFELQGAVGVRFLPAGRTEGGHAAAAAALADGLWRYWGRGGAGGGGGGGGDGGEEGDAALPALCPELTVLAMVVSAAQALVLQVLPAAEAGAGATAELAALTRPAVLLRVAAVLSSELLFRTPAGITEHLIRATLHHYFSTSLTTAVTNLRSSRPDAAAAAAATVGVEGAAQQLMERLRQMYAKEVDGLRHNMKRQQEEVFKTAKRLLGAAGASQAVALSPSGKAAAELAELRADQEKVMRGEVIARAGQRLTDAIFGAPWPAAAAGMLDEAAAAAVAVPAPASAAGVAGGGRGSYSINAANRQQRAGVPEGVVASGGPAAARGTMAAPLVLMMPQSSRGRVEWRSCGQEARSGKSSDAQMRAAFRWAAQESANRQAMARAMVGALAPCWEAAGAAAMTLEADATTASPPQPGCSPHSPSPRSLVLQGAPAICYSLARTAAVNYVLDRVARGLAVLAAIDAVLSSDSEPLDDNATGADEDDAQTAKPSMSDLENARMLAISEKLQHLLPQYQRACGWPLVMTLCGNEDAAVCGAERQQVQALEELLQALPSIDPEPDVPALLRRQSSLVATWTTQRPPARWPGPLEQQQHPQLTLGGGRGGDSGPAAVTGASVQEQPAQAAAGAAGGGGGGSTLQAAVAARAMAAPQVPVPAGSDDTMARHAVRNLVDLQLQRHPLRAARVQPADAQQTTAMAVALAQVSHQLRSQAAAAAPRELAVVPLLDRLEADDELKPVRCHLDGIVSLVIRDVSVALTCSIEGAEREEDGEDEEDEEDEEGEEGTQSEEGAQSEVGEQQANGQPDAQAAATSATEEHDSGQCVLTCRDLRSDWQHRLPLALNRAVCRLAGVPVGLTGWTLSDLSRLQKRRRRGDDRAAKEARDEQRMEDEQRGVRYAMNYINLVTRRTTMTDAEHVEGASEAVAQEARAVARSTRQLVKALMDIVDAAGEWEIDRFGDAEEGARDGTSLSLTSVSDLFADLVPGMDPAGEKGLVRGGFRGMGFNRLQSIKQPLQLLVAEAVPGRPTELVEGPGAHVHAHA